MECHSIMGLLIAIIVFIVTTLMVITPTDAADSIHSSNPLKESAGHFDIDCPVGFYSIFCNQQCNCRNNVTCNRTTGACPDGCALGFKGPVCDVCDDGFFGPHCNATCHCLHGHSACNQSTGECTGGCAIGYIDPACQNLTGFPKIESITNADIVNIASEMAIACTASGLPFPNITLTSENFTLVEGSATEYDMVDSKVLTVQFRASNTSGVSQLTCTAVSVHGSVNLTFNVSTVDPPQLEEPPKIGTTGAENVSLTWSSWQYGSDKGGAPSDSPNYRVVYRETHHSDWSVGSDWSGNNFAMVEDLQPDTDYVFAVQAKREGKEGEGQGPVGPGAQTFTKCKAPTSDGKPINLTATIKSSAAVYFQWKKPSIKDLGCSLIKYNLSCAINGSTASINVDGISLVKVTYEMKGFKPNSTYICNMYAISLEASHFGFKHAEVSFHTPNPVPGPVQHLQYEPFGSSSRHSLIKWAHPKNIPENTIKEYIVMAKLLNINSCNNIPPETNITCISERTVATQANLTGMYPYAKYLVTLRTQSKDDQLGEETSLTVETQQDVPEVKPSEVSSMPVNSTTVKFFWDPIPCDKANGAVVYRYSLRYTDDKKTRRRKRNSDWIVKDKETNDSSVTISGLTLTKPYEFSVRGVTPTGEGPSAIIQKKPDNGSYSPDFKLSSITQSSVLVMITPSEKMRDEIVNFQLQIQKKDDLKNTQEITLQPRLYASFVTILLPYTSYFIKCRANLTDIGWTDWSKPKTFLTAEGAPTAPDILVIEQLNASAVTVQWQPPAVSNGIIHRYQVAVFNLTEYNPVNYTKPLIKHETANNKSLQMTVNGMKPGESYVIEVKARTGYGYGIASIRNFTMDPEEDEPVLPPKVVAGAPIILACTVINATAIEVRWMPPEVTGGPIFNYKLEFQVLDEVMTNARSISEDTVSIETTDNYTSTMTYDGLFPGTNYVLSLMAKTANGYGRAGISNFTTADLESEVPRITACKVLNGTAVHVLWKPPTLIKNPVLCYKLEFQILDAVDSSTKPPEEIISYETPNNTVLDVTYNGLLPGKTYIVNVMAKTVNGYGNATSYNFTMAELVVEDTPTIVTYRIYNSSAVYVEWKHPKDVSGTLINYKVQFKLLNPKSVEEMDSSENFTAVETTDNVTVNITYDGLLPTMTYMLSVTAKTTNGYSKADTRNFTMPDMNDSRRAVGVFLPPPPPVVIRIIPYESDPSEISVVVKLFPTATNSWSAPSYYDVVIAEEGHTKNLNESKLPDYYYAKEHNEHFWVAARLSPTFFASESNHEFTVGDKKTYTKYFNGPLKADQSYYIMTRAVGSPEASTSYLSPMAAVASKDDPEPVFGPCILFGISCVWFLMIVIILLFLFWVLLAVIILYQRRKRKGNVIKKSDKFSKTNRESVSGKSFASNKEDMSSLTVFVQSPDDEHKTETFKASEFFGPIPIKDLTDYINMRASHPTLKFQEEFMQATRNKELNAPWNVSKKSANLKKNRYGNILPFDLTRVRLEPLPGLPDSDYINASFIDGYDKPKIYIATQGPKENTFHDFWRMIWQERVSVIVMLTALIEHKKRKCDQYWPNQSRLFGDILVTLSETEHLADIVIRRFEMKLVGNTEIRHVTHYHFSDWPDLSIPPCVTTVLQLRREVREDLPLNAGPIVVHCSGGAGRTGTFIAIDAMLKQAYDEERVYVYDYVHKIQSQRLHLIQTPDQYKFVYDAILEAVQSGDTKVLCSRLPIYYRDISRTSDTEPSDLSEQFNILSKLEQRKSSFPYPEALNEENLNKNRSELVLPVEHSRVRLLSDSSRGSSQSHSEPYINAVLCDGFKQKGQFLVTQMPLDCTIEDFWHMVVRHRSSVIIMLNDCEFIDEHVMSGQYWPNDGCTQYGPFQVEVVTFEEKGMINCRTLRVEDTTKADSEPQCVIQLQFLGWTPGDVVPSSTASIVALLNMTDVVQRKYGGPLTVHCVDGASRSGLFCVSHVLKEQVGLGEVDIFTAVKRLRRHRPQFITSLEQYQFCYEVAIELLSGCISDTGSGMATTSI